MFQVGIGETIPIFFSAMLLVSGGNVVPDAGSLCLFLTQYNLLNDGIWAEVPSGQFQSTFLWTRTERKRMFTPRVMGRNQLFNFIHISYLIFYLEWCPSMNFRPTKPSAIESVSLRDQALHLPNYHSSTQGNISLNYSHYFSLFKPLVAMSSTFELILGIMYKSFRQKDRCI